MVQFISLYMYRNKKRVISGYLPVSMALKSALEI